MLGRLLRNFFDFLRTDSRWARAPEYALGLGMGLWGLLIMLPGQAFQTTGGFRYVAQTPWGELGWGGAIAMLGTAQFFGTWFHARWPRMTRWLRVASAFGTGALWIGIGASLLIARPGGSWPIFLVIIAGLEAGVFVRHSLRGPR